MSSKPTDDPKAFAPSDPRDPKEESLQDAPPFSHAPMPSSNPRHGPNLHQHGQTSGQTTAQAESTGQAGRDAFAPQPQAAAPGARQNKTRPRGEPTKPLPKFRRKKPRSGAARTFSARIMKEATSFALDKKPGPIVPKGTIAGHALVLVIAIMSFLAALTVAAVTIISDATRDWQSDISRGATIQIRSIDGVDIESELSKAVTIARGTPGIASATVLSQQESNALLEPWLGLDLQFDDLPVPRLIELVIADPAGVDFLGLSDALQQQVTGAVLDNHRFWVERLRSMAETAILIGFSILVLVITATILTVVFATRSAMAGNKETIEVLHFVGAGNRFIAGEFQRRFFTLGFQGSLAGGGIAIFVFLILQVLVREDEGSAAVDQVQALLGVVQLGYTAYLGTLALVIMIAIFTAITTRLTVINTLSKLT